MEQTIVNTNVIQGKEIRAQRNSSVELLRIFAACAVVVLHYNGMGGALAASKGITHELLLMLECLSVCAVDLFIMISGYFLCVTQKRTLDKPVYLLLLLWVINIIVYFIKSYVTGGGINPITIAHIIIPPANYFVVLYLAIYIVSPYINIVLDKLSDKGRTYMVIVLLLLFSVYPTLIDSYQLVMHHEFMGISPVGAWGQQHGYTIVGFSLCYVLGAWLRLNSFKWLKQNWRIICLIAIAIAGIYLWYKVEEYTVLGGASKLIEYNALSYSNPLVLLLTFLLLSLSLNIHFKSSFVNILAKSTFVCYILHLSVVPFLRAGDFAARGGLAFWLHLVLSVLAIYIVSWIVWLVLDWLLRPIVKRLKNISLISQYE